MAQISIKLCDERHATIEKRLTSLENLVDKFSLWLVGTLTALCLNLIGVIALLIRTTK